LTGGNVAQWRRNKPMTAANGLAALMAAGAGGFDSHWRGVKPSDY